MCLTHSEAKQTGTLEFGAKKDLLQGQLKQQVACAQNSWTPKWFWGQGVIDKIWSEDCLLCDFLLSDWWWGNRAVALESYAQLEVAILLLDGSLSSSRRTQRYCYIHIPWWGASSCFNRCTIISWLLPLCFCFLSLPWLAAVWIGWKLRPFSYKPEKGDTKRLWDPGGPHRVPLDFKAFKSPEDHLRES